MVTPLTHPDMLTNLRNFYPSLCTVQAGTPSSDAIGGESTSWADRTGLIAIPCAVAPASQANVSERQRAEQTYVVSTHRIALRGYYATIVLHDRAVVGSQTFDIVGVEHDSQQETTYLQCQIVTA